MTDQHFYDNLFNLSLQYPSSVSDFLKKELKLGKKYVIIDVHTHNAQLSKLMSKHVHLICSLTSDPAYNEFLKIKFQKSPNFICLNSIPEVINIDDDSIDCICIDDTFTEFNTSKMSNEFERVLRLNSYVILLQNQFLKTLNSFSKDFQDFMDENNFNTIVKTIPAGAELKSFYKNGYQQQVFQSQKSFTLNELQQFFSTIQMARNFKVDEKSTKSLVDLFQQHQKNGQVILEYQTMLYYGLFNHSVPEISLRKSIFFHALRPFAFGFYVLVKGNIYFWRALYKLKEKIFGNKAT